MSLTHPTSARSSRTLLPSTGAPARRTRAGLRSAQLRRAALPGGTTVAILVLAEVASRTGLVSAEYVPPISAVLERSASLASAGALWASVVHTVTQAVTALGVAALIAVPLGLLTGMSRLLDDLTAYTIELLRPVPSVALIPLFILVIGTGTQLAVALGAFAATWPLLIQTRAGLKEADPLALETARVFGLPWLARVRWVLLPSAAPLVATGLRISATLALILAVTAELVASAPGLGRDVALAQSAGDSVTMYAFVLVTGLVGVTLNTLLRAGERRLLAWHPAVGAGR